MLLASPIFFLLPGPGRHVVRPSEQPSLGPILKRGRELPLHAGIQALAASSASAVASAIANEMEADAMASGGGSAYGNSSASRPGMVGGVGSTAGATAGTVTNAAASVPESATSAGGSTAGSVGHGRTRHGLRPSYVQRPAHCQQHRGNWHARIALSSQAAHGSVIASYNQSVHLEGGTQIVLRVSSQ
jgi:hypothetical protein